MLKITPKSLKLPQSLIPSLQSPMGTFFIEDSTSLTPEKRVIEHLRNQSGLVFVVGDFVANSLLTENFLPDLIIIDEKTQRNKPFKVKLPEKLEILEVNNPPGEINKSSWEVIRILCSTVFDLSDEDMRAEKILKVIKVIGEEDLLVLPLIIDAPLGSFILYGQPPMIDGNQGIVLIEVTDASKNRVIELLNKFEII